MESSVPLELRQLSSKIELLAAQRDEAVEALRESREEAEDLKRRLKAMQEELHSKTLDVEYLTVSHKLADNPEALAQARAKIREMIGRIDKAVAMLKEDARI